VSFRFVLNVIMQNVVALLVLQESFVIITAYGRVIAVLTLS
jgi:hypothetical protein